MLFIKEAQVGQFNQGERKIYQIFLHQLEKDCFSVYRRFIAYMRMRFGLLLVAQANFKERRIPECDLQRK